MAGAGWCPASMPSEQATGSLALLVTSKMIWARGEQVELVGGEEDRSHERARDSGSFCRHVLNDLQSWLVIHKPL